MFHPKKRARFIVVVLTALSLMIATASIAVARPHSAPNAVATTFLPPPPPGPSGHGGGGATPTPTRTNNSLSPPGPGGGSNTGSSSAAPPPSTVNGLIKPFVYPWPPPNAIVLHPATPIQLSQAGSGLRVYFINRYGDSKIGPFFDNFSILADNYVGDPVTLYKGRNPGTGKPVTIDYLPSERKLRVSTFYADKPPHDYNKPYVFTIDAAHNIVHEQW